MALTALRNILGVRLSVRIWNTRTSEKEADTQDKIAYEAKLE